MALKLVSNFRKGIRPFLVKNEPGQGQVLIKDPLYFDKCL